MASSTSIFRRKSVEDSLEESLDRSAHSDGP